MNRTGPPTDRAITNRAVSILAFAAFGAGVLSSLAIRPPSRTAAKNNHSTHESLEVIRWRTPSVFPLALPILGEQMSQVSREVLRISRSRLTVEVFDPGKLVPAFSISQAVRDGKVEAGFTWLGYDMGRIPLAPLLSSVPFGMEPWEFTAWWYEGGGRQIAESTYATHGVHPILCGLIGPETAGWFRSEIRSVEDIRGLKIRFAGLGGRVLQDLGASVTVIPAGEIYPALEKGAIDATEFSLPEIDQRMGFSRIVKYNLYPGWHQPFTAFHLIVNLQRWEELDASLKGTVEATCTAGVARMLSRAEANQGAFIERLRAEGITAARLGKPLLFELRAATDRMLQTQAAEDAEFARVLQAQRTFRAQYRTWRDLAYLAPEERGK